MEDKELEVIERQISEIVKADLYERFPTGFVFDPIRVYPRTDHMGDDYLKIFIIRRQRGRPERRAHRGPDDPAQAEACAS